MLQVFLSTAVLPSDYTSKRLKVSSVNKGLRHVLKNLTLPYGEMWPAFWKLRRVRDKNSYIDVVFNSKGTPIAWSLSYPTMYQCSRLNWQFYTFVDRRYRRKGVGTFLYNQSLNLTNTLPVPTDLLTSHWDERSEEFFHSVT